MKPDTRYLLMEITTGPSGFNVKRLWSAFAPDEDCFIGMAASMITMRRQFGFEHLFEPERSAGFEGLPENASCDDIRARLRGLLGTDRSEWGLRVVADTIKIAKDY
jgi:hypothetical protein